jgi:hypothetical protein
MALDFPSSPATGQTYTGSDGTIWKWDGAKWVSGVTAGVLSASQMDLGTRLAAAGTKLNALGPVTSVNAPSGTVMTALDGAMNYQSGAAANHTWNLPPVTSGAYLIIRLPNNSNSCTITPAGSDLILSPASKNYSNAAPMVIPPLLAGAGACVFLSGVPPFWIADAAAEIEKALGWVSHPYCEATYNGPSITITTSTWTHFNCDLVVQDSHGWWDAANHRYNPKRAGKYLATFIVALGDTQTGNSVVGAQCQITLNGANGVTTQIGSNGATMLGNINALPVTHIFTMNGSTDYIDLWVLVTSAATPTLIGSGLSRFTVTYLGP